MAIYSHSLRYESFKVSKMMWTKISVSFCVVPIIVGTL